MIYIVSGAIDSGKTTILQDIFKTVDPDTAGGFISSKTFGEKFTGYETVCLSTGIKATLAILVDEYQGQFSIPIFYQQFVFSQQGFDFGSAIINQLVDTEAIENIFIDEIGPLELNQGGFYQAFKQAIQSQKNVYAVIRTSCLAEILNYFNIKGYQIIS
jgi:nucleoside-triphosphatase THEP1